MAFGLQKFLLFRGQTNLACDHLGGTKSRISAARFKKEIEVLTAQRDYLLPLLMTGQVRVEA